MDAAKPPSGARRILQYFLSHPAAADSLSGIARWRLLEETVRQSVEETEQALRWLVGRGFLMEHASVGTDPTFHLNGQRITEAQNFVRTAQFETQQRNVKT